MCKFHPLLFKTQIISLSNIDVLKEVIGLDKIHKPKTFAICIYIGALDIITAIADRNTH
jgi:hypothetical protein